MATTTTNRMTVPGSILRLLGVCVLLLSTAAVVSLWTLQCHPNIITTSTTAAASFQRVANIVWSAGLFLQKQPTPSDETLEVKGPHQIYPSHSVPDHALTEIRKFNADFSPRVLNVHVVPHTHDDVGWCKTVDQYYYGWNNTIAGIGNVQSIIATVVESLLDHPSRTFSYVEQKFFSMWWNEQNDAIKDSVRYLIANHQLIFVNGGWCMHDEATTHYVSMIDQTTLGHEFLYHEMGVIPTVGWQLDPFGHSATQASLMTSKMGFDALYFGRIDYQDLNLRKLTQQCEGLWDSSSNFNDTTVFWGLTGSYGGNYGPPSGFWFDIHTGEKPLIGAPQDVVLQRLHTFLEYVRLQSDQTQGNHILMTMGSDFHFEQAPYNFANYDMLIGSLMSFQAWDQLDIPTILPNYDKVNVFYSNPEYYTECKYHEMTQQQQSRVRTKEDAAANAAPSAATTTTTSMDWQVKHDDFFPYSDGPHSFWTGYFTSRAAFKRLERVASGFLLAARQIQTLLVGEVDAIDWTDQKRQSSPLYALEDALGIAQHHDAVSGTAKQHVANDYSFRIQTGFDRASHYVATKLREVLLHDHQELSDLSYCPLLNETICPISETATQHNDTALYVIVYNSLATERSSIVRFPVGSKSTYSVARVTDQHDEEAGPSQLVQANEASPLESCPMCHTKHVLMFDSGPIPPVGAVAFRITMADTSPPREGLEPNEYTARSRILSKTESSSSSLQVSNGVLKASFDRATGMLQGISSNGVELSVTQEWGFYTSFDTSKDKSDVEDWGQNSGAYIFRPSEPEQQLTLLTPAAGRTVIVNTTVGKEVHVSFHEPWMKQVTRIFHGQPYVEVEYTVGPIPIDDGRGKEIVTRLSSSIQSDRTFYTDSNGREFLQRKRNHRPTWALSVYEPVAGNYYPVNAAMYIEDDSAALSVLVDRSQGGASLREGSLEIMVQRRTLADDGRGVDEALNETSGGMSPYPPYGNRQRIGDGVILRGTHRILVGPGRVGASLCRSAMDDVFAAPVVLFGSAPIEKPVQFRQASFSAIQSALPPNVMLVTYTRLYNRDQSTFLVRLAHQFGINEDENLSVPVEVDLSSLFRQHSIVHVSERTLSGNQNLKDRLQRRKRWTTKSDNTDATYQSVLDGTNTTFTLSPMDIRTFEIVVQPVANQDGTEDIMTA